MKAFLHTLRSRVEAPFRRRRFEREMAEEMQAHVAVLTEENLAAGMSPNDARWAALRRFGGVVQLQEECREGRRFVWLEQLRKDAAFVLRSLRRAPFFSMAVIGTLVLGIGVGTVAFNLTSWVLLFPQPYPDAERLYQIGFTDQRGGTNPYRFGCHWQAYREQTSVLSQFAAATNTIANVVVEGQPSAGAVISVSVDCFQTFGVTPVLGRGFRPEEHQAGASDVVVITDSFWRRRFGGSSEVLGRTLLIDQRVCTVVGVLALGQPLPPTFRGEVYRPLTLIDQPANPLGTAVFIVGRLRDGVTPEQARALLETVTLPDLPVWAKPYLAEQQLRLMPLAELNHPDAFWVVFAAGALLYGIACLNAASLMLVRLMGRHRELGIRLALGGTRWQIAQLVVIESVSLAAAASLVVLGAVRWWFPSLFAFLWNNEEIRHYSYWEPRTLGCVIGLALGASLLVALVPVWRLSRAGMATAVKEGGAAAGESRFLNRFRGGMVVAQAALAVILLAGTGLMARSFERLQRVNLGFNPRGMVKVQLRVPPGYDLGPEQRLQLFERLEKRLALLRGVRAVSFGQDSVLVGGYWGTAQVLMPDGRYQPVAGNFVGEDFLRTAGLRLVKGRWLSGNRGEYEVVINEAFARARFGDADPVGQSFRLLVSGDYDHRVVGVVGDVKEAIRSTPGMRFYAPTWVYPLNISTLLLRLETEPPKEFAGLVREAIYQIDPQLITSAVDSAAELVAQSLWVERFAFKLLKGFTPIALGLAVIGLFSVLAFAVDCRKREFGVRLALGARPRDLRLLVIRRGLATAGAGVAVGTAAALALTRFMQSLLFETAPYDPLVYAAVAAVLLSAAVVACWWPARRAARVDVARLLRTE